MRGMARFFPAALAAVLWIGCPGGDDDTGDDDVTADDDDATGDDDDATADDDDATGDDDDSTGDDDDATGDDDTTEGAQLAEGGDPLVVISAPNWGMDLATDVSIVTLEGVARDDVIEVTYAADTGASGVADGTGAWTVAVLSLVQGDNRITVTGVTADGTEGSDEILIAFHPDVPFASGITLSPRVVLTGEPREVRADVWLADTEDLDEGSVLIGPADPAGELTETWAVLEETATPGLFAASFEVDEAQAQVLELRVSASFSGVEGTTPPVHFEVMDAPTEAELDALLALRGDVWTLAEGIGFDPDPTAAVEAVVDLLLADERVMAVGTSGTDGLGVWWIAEPGLPFAMDLKTEDLMGAANGTPAPGPRLHRPTGDVGRPRGWTHSPQGIVGRAPSGSRGPMTTGNAEAIVMSPYFDEFQPKGDIGGWLGGAMGSAICPRIEVDGPYLNADVRLETVAAGFEKGLQAIWSHGETYFAGGLDLPGLQDVKWRWLVDHPGAQVAVITREDVQLYGMNHYLPELLTGELAVAGQGPTGYMAYLPSWVKAQAIGNPMPDSLVAVTACRSYYNDTMAVAYLSAGAEAYYGFTESVSATYAGGEDQAFWTKLLARGNTGDAMAETSGPNNPCPHFGAFAYLDGEYELFIHGGELLNPGFEQGMTDWTPWGNGTFSVTGDVMGLNGTAAPEGSLMAHASFVAPSGTYESFSTPFCPLPGTSVTVDFKWQVITRYYGSCQAGVTNWGNMRIDRDEGNEVQWQVEWDTICPLLVDQGWGRATGWQDASITFTAPDTDHPDQESLTFATGGWDYEEWWTMIDDVQISN